MPAVQPEVREQCSIQLGVQSVNAVNLFICSLVTSVKQTCHTITGGSWTEVHLFRYIPIYGYEYIVIYTYSDKSVNIYQVLRSQAHVPGSNPGAREMFSKVV